MPTTYTIDFFASPDSTALDSRVIDCATLPEAIEQAELILASPDAVHLHTGSQPVAGYVITDDLNVVVHSTFDAAPG